MTASADKGPVLGQRHVQIIFLYTCHVVNYMTKFNAGICVVAMTNAATTNPNFPEYNWSQMEKSYILSSFFWGFVITQFPAGNICRYFGVKKTLFVSTLGSSVVGLLVPFTVDWGGWQIFCAIRFVQGMFQGLELPGIHAHLAVWCPVEERNRLGAMASTGIETGIVLAIFLSGMIAASSMGWPGIFYVSCGMGVVWCIFWLIYAANTPNESKRITEIELNFIQSSINKMKKEQDSKGRTEKIPVPWRAILTSMPVWALLMARSAEMWGFTTIQTQVPSYMKGVFDMDMRKNAIFSALPYITLWCMAYVYLILADTLLNRKVLTLNGLRKTYNTIAFWIPAAGLIALGFVDSHQQTLAVVLMVVIVGFNSGNMIGSGLNTIDLSPNHAGVLMSLTNASASIWPIVTPLLAGAIVKEESDRTHWQIVFAISAAVFFFGNLFYIIFGTTNLQEWDDPHYLVAKNHCNEQHKNGAAVKEVTEKYKQIFVA
uniref:Putative inorganic phosphate cotransporter n=2 Tax=Stomoxys calcitrans TaxID=35570 RepID=A0A1I8PRN9_STOCA